MFLKIFLILLIQVRNTILDSYDDDINIAYASIQTYRTYSEDQVRYLDPTNNCYCKEFAGIDVHCYGKQCYSMPTIINSDIKLFKLKLTSISIIEKDAFVPMKKLVSLEINANAKLYRIVPGCFANMAFLKNFSLIGNVNLKYLEKNVFEGLVNVEQMVFQKNGFTRVLDITITLSPAIVPKVSLLDISESMFHQVHADDFHPMNGTVLKELNLILCEIEYVHPNCLQPLKNISALRLGQNIFNLTMLTQLILNCNEFGIPLNYLSLFDIGLRKNVPIKLMEAIAASNITYLSLAHNHFDFIHDTSFPHMPRLIELDLRSNFIVDISDNAFKQLTALRRLHLGENKLICVPKGIITSQLTHLDLAGNTFDGAYFNIQESVFFNMSNIQELQLAYNFLNYLERNTFTGLENLRKLNLKSTSIQFIERGSFQGLTNLKQLNLMNNPFTSSLLFNLTADIFEGLTNLEVLLLGGCSIKNLTQTPSIFSNVPNLIYLGLERTEIHVIAPGQLTILNSLKTLNLADNKLASWSKPILPLTLKCLYAQQNKISYVTEAMLTDMQNLEYLYLDGNPFSCDCSLYSVLPWLEKHNISLVRKDSDRPDFVARCISPELWRHKSVVTFLQNLAQDPNKCIPKDYNQIIILAIIILCAVICMSFWIFFTQIL